MNKLFYILFAFITIGFCSCETDVDINAESEDITVVYGLIEPNANESKQFLKINKTFLGEESALDLAGNSSNFNYSADELDITVEACNESGEVKKTYSTGAGTIFRTVDEVIKEEGLFDSSNNVLYKFIEPNINRDYTYKIKIIDRVSGKEVSSQTEIVDTIIISNPRDSRTIFNFWNGIVLTGNAIPQNFSVTTGANVARVSIDLFFNYTQFYTISSGKDSSVHFVKMSLPAEQANSSLGGAQLSWSLKGDNFF
jgi:hypothetical protein